MMSNPPKTKAEITKNVMAILLDENPAEQNTPQALYVDNLVPYNNHLFKLYEGDRLNDMARSIKENGVIVPVIVRPIDKNEKMYEILSGHNRVNAAKLAGLERVPVRIKKGLTDDEAALIVTETNLIQRSFTDLSHSERAVILKNHMEAIRKQGKRNDFINEIERLSNPDEINQNGDSGLIVPKAETRDKTAEKYGLDARSVSRYIRLSYLTPELLRRVDTNEIGLYPAVSLSYLSHNEQEELNRLLDKSSYKVDMKKAEAIRGLYESKKLTNEKMEQVLSGELNRKPKTAPALKIKPKVYSKYFHKDTSVKEMEAVIEQALAKYFENRKGEETE
jgi:ParB family chromosome partitioning protein